MGTGALRGNHFSGTGAKCSNDWSQRSGASDVDDLISYVVPGKRLAPVVHSKKLEPRQVALEIHDYYS